MIARVACSGQQTRCVLARYAVTSIAIRTRRTRKLSYRARPQGERRHVKVWASRKHTELSTGRGPTSRRRRPCDRHACILRKCLLQSQAHESTTVFARSEPRSDDECCVAPTSALSLIEAAFRHNSTESPPKMLATSATQLPVYLVAD